MDAPTWLAPAIAAIDAANAQDPNRIDDAGEDRPKELVHAERMTSWLARLAPDADAAQQLAARAHHFERWRFPRADYPEGRAGYLKWRKHAREQHAADVAALLRDHGVDEDVVTDTTMIISKPLRSNDARVQTHEDCLCLTFFELQGLSTAELLGDKTEAVVVKTLEKMSPEGRAALADAELHPAVRVLAETLLAQAPLSAQGVSDVG